jgi:hypothetical protein
MKISFDYFEEPKLQFGNYFEHEDAKTGLAEYGPFGRNVSGLHVSEIRLGFIGTRESISGAKEWIERCSGYIESENIKTIIERVRVEDKDSLLLPFADELELESTTIRRLEKILNRDFDGFNKDTRFGCCFQINPRWERSINHRELEWALEKDKDKKQRILETVALIENELRSITQTDPTPDVVIIALTKDIEGMADSVRISRNYFLNLRRAIKARAMNQHPPLPVQILRHGTIEGKGRIQEPATRAWNFCTAQYYKAGGVPWIPTTLEKDTCYVGISFYIAKDFDDKLTMRSSIAQAFDFLGQGLILRGEPFEWDVNKLGPSPHLTKEGAKRLITDTLEEYVRVRGNPPSRVVIHKTSEFWGEDREDYNEIEGLYNGIDEVAPRCETDFVTLRQTGLRLFREGIYPPLRGTYFCMEGRHHFLFTMGFVPYLETYPGSYVPEPWQVTQHVGGSSPKDLLREVLSLTKMNVNNCNFADGTPITISFSRKVGEIMKHIGKDEIVQSSYRFYM